MPEQTRRSNAGELSPFDIADWLWSFRWLAAGLIVCAAIWTALMLLPAGDSNTPEELTHQLVIDLYASGTPVRSVSEITDIYRARLVTPELWMVSAVGANPIVLHSYSKNVTEGAATESRQISDELLADVRSLTDSLAPYMQREFVPEMIAGQYIKNTAFLDGVEAGLIEISRPTVSQLDPPSRGGPGARLSLPWVACGVLFLVLAGGITFISRWKAHRQVV